MFGHGGRGCVGGESFNPNRPDSRQALSNLPRPSTGPKFAWNMAQLHELVNPQLLKVGIGTLFVAYAARLLINYRNAIASFNNLPGYRAFLAHDSILAMFLPKWRHFSGAEIFEFWNKRQRMSAIHGRPVIFTNHCTKREGFEETGLDIISVVCVWPSNAPTLLLADPDAIKVIGDNVSLTPSI